MTRKGAVGTGCNGERFVEKYKKTRATNRNAESIQTMRTCPHTINVPIALSTVHSHQRHHIHTLTHITDQKETHERPYRHTTLRCQKSRRKGSGRTARFRLVTCQDDACSAPNLIQEKKKGEVLTSLVPMTLHVPIRMCISRIILLIAAHLNLLEPPFRQRIIPRPQTTPQMLMLKPQPRRQRMPLSKCPLLPRLISSTTTSTTQ